MSLSMSISGETASGTIGPASGVAAGEATGAGDVFTAGPSLRAAVEAVLLVVDTPVDATTLAQVCERPRGEVEATLEELAAEYAAEGRGIALREVAGGWR